MMERYVNYLSNFTRRDRGKNLMLSLGLIFLVLAYKLANGSIYESIRKLYKDKTSYYPNFSNIANVFYNSYDYIICFTVLIIATAWLKKSNDEWEREHYQKLQEEEERLAKEESLKEKNQLETIKEENEEDTEDNK